MEDEGAMEELVHQIEGLRQKPGISQQYIFTIIREHFIYDECEIFITTAITRIYAEEQITEYREFKQDGIELDLTWNSNMDADVCPECRSRHGKTGPWDDSSPPLHNGRRCWLTMRIRR